METKKDFKKRISLVIDPETHYKLRYLAGYEGRSGNQQILYSIRSIIKLFEKKHGEIEVPPK